MKKQNLLTASVATGIGKRAREIRPGAWIITFARSRLSTLGFGTVLVFGGAASFGPLCWSIAPTPAQSFAEEQAGDVVNADYYVDVEFAPGSKLLTVESQQKIQSLVATAKKAGAISSISILSWADDEFPSSKVKSLPEPQKALAAQRNSSLKQYVNATQAHKAPVTTYSMAEQSNTLQKFLGTTDARLKRSLVAAGLPTTADNPRFPSKASHALIFISVQ